MTPEQHQRVKMLFGEACVLEGESRRAFLERHCDDPLIRLEVEALLGHDDAPNAGLRTPALGIALTSTLGRAIESSHRRETPTRIGHYRIIKPLGEGGMGIVYVAEQDRPRRTVALKVIRRGFGASSLLKRFEHEAELLGRLHHPGIAQIYEAGIADEGTGPQPFIAMELVQGQNLLDFVASNKPTTRQRLELVIKIADAVQHAHTRGIIHRDLKPANILVDETGQPKVLDFGVARATDQDLQLTSVETSLGQLVGTLPYMSPEQVSGNTSEVDTRSDVYALGVILYQLLTGKLPHNLTGRSIPEMARIIRDDAPQRLSTVDKVFRGDIDTIVSKAMDKDRVRRYQTASELAEDLRRYLAGQPIAARHDSTMYVLRKQLTRYRGAVAAAGLFLLLLIGFAVFAAVQAGRQSRLAQQASLAQIDAERKQRRAEEAEARAKRDLTFANVERGRLQVRLGNFRQAEDLVWPVYLDNPKSTHARGALWELLEAQPLEATWKTVEYPMMVMTPSPDLEHIFVAHREGDAQLWRREERTLVRSWSVPDGVESGAYAPDGGRVYLGNARGMISEWDVATGSMVRSWMASHEGPSPINAIAVSESGMIAALSQDGYASVFDPQGERVAHFVSNGGSVGTSVIFSPDGEVVVTAGYDYLVHLVNWRTGEEVLTLRGHRHGVGLVRYFDGGKRLLTGSADKTVKVWDASTGECLRTVSGTNGSVRCLLPSPDGRWLVTGGSWTTEVWDMEVFRTLDARPGVDEHEIDQSLRPKFTFGTGCIRAFFPPDGAGLVTSDSDGVLRLWTLEAWGALRLYRTPSDLVTATALDDDGERLVAAGEGGELQLIGVATGAARWAIEPNLGAILRAMFSPDGESIAISTRTGRVALFKASDGSLIREFARHGGMVNNVRFTPDGAVLMTCSADKRLRMFDVGTGELKQTLVPPKPADEASISYYGDVLDAAVTPDGALLVTVSRHRRIDFWRLPDGEHLDQRQSSDSVWTVELSPDGSRFAVTTWSGMVEVWDVATRSKTHVLRDHRTISSGAAFTPDGKFLISSSSEGTIIVWDLATGENVMTLPPSGPSVSRRAVIAKNRALVAIPYGPWLAGVWDLTHADGRIEANRAYHESRLAAQRAGDSPGSAR